MLTLHYGTSNDLMAPAAENLLQGPGFRRDIKVERILIRRSAPRTSPVVLAREISRRLIHEPAQ